MIGERKNREKRREKRKTYLIAQISSKRRSCFIRGPIKLKFEGKVWNSSSYNMNSEIRFWARELVLLPLNSNDIFLGIIYPIFLCFFFQERLYNPRLYVLLMYLVASRDYSREDKCNPLLLIVEVWTGLDPVVFPIALGVFHIKILVFDLFFCGMSLFIYCC